MCKNFRILVMTALAVTALAGCGHVGEGSDDEPIFTSDSTSEKRSVHTTKTAAFAVGDVDVDDEDAEGGYTTTTTVSGSLENDQLFDDVDEDIRATQRTEAKTYYSIPEHNGTTGAILTVSAEKTTTTANGTISIEDPTSRPTTKAVAKTTTTAATTKIVSNKIFRMESSMEYETKRKYTVVSDTTYLNLRFGPSKEYDIRTTIPDGSTITGYGETVGPDGNVWVATLYNGTSGWVMKDLLSD